MSSDPGIDQPEDPLYPVANYQKIPEIVIAGQWEGELEVIHALDTNDDRHWLDKRGNLYVGTQAGSRLVNRGDWIYRQGDTFGVMTDRDFTATYTPCR